MASMIWAATLAEIENDRKEAETAAYALAASLSSSYFEQVSATIGYIDQLTLFVKYDWEHSKGGFGLEARMKQGLRFFDGKTDISVINRDGISVESTVGEKAVYLGDRDYFKYHRSNSDPNLHYDDSANLENQSGRFIRFSRRLNAADGSFGGVIVVGVDPAYFASFNAEDSLKPRDFISIRNDKGTLLISEKGADIRGLEVHLIPPSFSADKGVKYIPRDHFKDHEGRILAWHKLNQHPLFCYVGLSETAVFSGHREGAEKHRTIAIVTTFFLLIICVMGMYFSSRLAWRKKQSEEIRSTFHLAIDAAREGFFMVRPFYGNDGIAADFVIEDCNERGAKFLGYTKQELVGAKMSDLYPGKRGQRVLAIYRSAMEAGFYEDEFKVHGKDDGAPVWIHRRLVRSEIGLAATLRDISEVKVHETALINLANSDSLTELPNRHWLVNFLPSALQKAKTNGTILALLYLDLDGFKNVNDTSGHLAGDALLKEASARLKSVLRPKDVAIRLGGDEFTVVLHDMDHRDEVAHVAHRIIQAFRAPFEIASHRHIVGTSIGISLFPDDGEDTEALLQQADMAMYAAKDDGKGKFRFYDQRLFSQVKTRLDAEQELSVAISCDQFVMHYQPRVDTQSGKLIGMEALVRWLHPLRGIVSPNDFIPLAEKTGMILELGELVIEKVCAQLALWQSQQAPVVPISLNISAQQFNAGGVDLVIAKLLEKYQLSASIIEVELTESAMTSETVDILEQVSALSNMGIKLHLDDFGTGYSSLSRLQELNMHVLKIDRAFTSKLGSGKQAEVLFNTIVLMAKALNMRVVAEGVETLEQLQILQKLRCDEIQGYLISRPLPASDIPALIYKGYLFIKQAAPEILPIA